MSFPRNIDLPPNGDTVVDTTPREVLTDLGNGVTIRELYGFRPTETITTDTKLRLMIIWGAANFKCPGAKNGSVVDKYVHDYEEYYLEAGASYSFTPHEDFVSIREEKLDDSTPLPKNPGPVEKIP